MRATIRWFVFFFSDGGEVFEFAEVSDVGITPFEYIRLSHSELPS